MKTAEYKKGIKSGAERVIGSGSLLIARRQPLARYLLN
jgi:hypothetical protein